MNFLGDLSGNLLNCKVITGLKLPFEFKSFGKQISIYLLLKDFKFVVVCHFCVELKSQ